MQLTNIARDVGQDARAGRLYLPLDWLSEAGIDADAFVARPIHSAALAGVVERLLRRADELYARADEGIAMLPRDCRASIRAARLIYAEIGRAIERAGFDAVSRRAVVPARRKVWLLLRSFFGSGADKRLGMGERALGRSAPREGVQSEGAQSEGARGALPPLEETRFLVEAAAIEASRPRMLGGADP
jgi:phytoene synthase